MQMNTFLKVGSLAFNVANDEKVQELFTMIHKGAKRRGLISLDGMVSQNTAPNHVQSSPIFNHPIPFAPVKQSVVPPQSMQGGFDIRKHITMDNAKKVLNFAGTIANVLSK